MQIQDIPTLYRWHGKLANEGEGITKLQHAWQCAQLARRAGATVALQLAAWLHDVGHLMTGLQGTPTARGINDGHETLAARALEPLLGPEVAQPIALHVDAKRYLVHTQPEYALRLSPDSVRSLALQGGQMTAAEAHVFIQKPFVRDALRLRTWDDLGKDPDWQPGSTDEALTWLHQLLGQVSSLHATPASGAPAAATT
jgi:phosphonate degradation associated HDIG domain protein